MLVCVSADASQSLATGTDSESQMGREPQGGSHLGVRDTEGQPHAESKGVLWGGREREGEVELHEHIPMQCQLKPCNKA